MLGICTKFGICHSPQSPDIGQNSDSGISYFGISGQSFIKENCHNSRGGNDIDKKLRPVSKLNKRNKAMSKKLATVSCQQFVNSLSFFQIMDTLKQSGSRIPDAWS